MLEAVNSIISLFSTFLNTILSVQISTGEDSYITLRAIFLFIFLLFAFIKFIAVVTHNQTVTRKE